MDFPRSLTVATADHGAGKKVGLQATEPMIGPHR
jgi:hypothetical protein